MARGIQNHEREGGTWTLFRPHVEKNKIIRQQFTPQGELKLEDIAGRVWANPLKRCKIFLYKTIFFQFEIIKNVLVSSFRFI